MARPLSEGLLYVGIPVNWFELPDHRIIDRKFGETASSIWLKLYLDCFAEKGYYRTMTEDDILINAAYFGVEERTLEELLAFLAKRGLIDGDLYYNKQIITSEDIQAVYQEAVKTRGARREIMVNGEYWLLSKEETRSYIKPTKKTHT